MFILGVALLLVAFWAGLNVVKQDTTTTDGTPAPDAAAPVQSVGEQDNATARYVVRVGSSFGTAERANQLTAELRRKYPSAHTQVPTGSDTLFRVQIGPYENRQDAQQVANDLMAQGLKGIEIVRWKQN